MMFGSGVAYSIDIGTENYRGFVIDNIYHSTNDGDIHYNVYIPDSYDGSRPYALFFTLPGYEGLYFQGVGRNLEAEDCLPTMKISWAGCSENKLAQIGYELDYMKMSAIFGGAAIVQ